MAGPLFGTGHRCLMNESYAEAVALQPLSDALADLGRRQLRAVALEEIV